MKVVITGRPGVGKTTLLTRIISILNSNGFKVGGISCPEVREQGVRIGFKIKDLITGEEAWLAKKEPGYPRIGRYHVKVDEAERVGVKAIERAIDEADVIAIDEIGPMELLCKGLKAAFIKALKSGKPVICVVHAKLNDTDIQYLLSDAWRIVVTEQNRDSLGREVPTEILNKLRELAKP